MSCITTLNPSAISSRSADVALLPPALVFGVCFNIVGTLAILNGWNIFLT